MSPIKTFTQSFLATLLLLSVILLTGCAGKEMAPGPYEESPVVDITVDDFFVPKNNEPISHT